MNTQEYIIEFLLGDTSIEVKQFVFYGEVAEAPIGTKVIIHPSNFFNDEIYGSLESLPKTPFPLLPNSDIPFLFGTSLLEKFNDSIVILHADIVASAYYMLSRYEEIIKKQCRDKFGRFLAKDSIVFQQGYGMRPLVDEWGLYLRNLLRQLGVIVPDEKNGLRKVYLTHDVDRPFYFNFRNSVIQFIKNIIHYGNYIDSPLKSYLNNLEDPFFTFPWILKHDNELKESIGDGIVQSIYFIICGKNLIKTNYKYFNIKHFKYKKLLQLLIKNKAEIGLHISHEGGINPNLICKEVKRLPKCVNKQNLKSRNHYLRWREPEHIEQFQQAGIKEDFSLEYPDCVGFRVGTCRPYKFINPKSKQITDVIVHPMQIMECSLCDVDYMNYSLEKALSTCKLLIKETYRFNGDVVLLFHNSAFVENVNYKILYTKLLDYLKEIEKEKDYL